MAHLYVDRLHLTKYCNTCSPAAPRLMDPRGLRVTQTTYFSLLIHAKQLSLVTFMIQLQELVDMEVCDLRNDKQT